MRELELPKEFTGDDIATLMAVAGQLGLSFTQTLLPVPGAFKIVKGVVTCALCQTVTTQYLKLAKYSNGAWLKEADLTEEEALTFTSAKWETYTAKVRSCWNCEAILLAKEKQELVDMVLKLYAPVPTREEVWKYVKEMRQSVTLKLDGFREGRQKEGR